jgi:hypothetical protein
MSETRKNTARWLLLAGFACLIGFDQANAAISVPLSGAIGGTVRGPGGTPQIGASVTLYNHLQRPLGKVLTDERGEFKLLGLFPAVYSVKISLAAFIPATRQILVQPGMRSILNVNLSTLFSSIQFAYPVVENSNIMSEDWKWVLRSAPATRPVLRYLDIDADAAPNAGPGTQSQAVASTVGHANVFSDTRGLLNVSAGDGSMNAGVSTQADLGATFALATSLYGNSLVEFSGNFGYGSVNGGPATAFRTSYSREIAGGTPEVSLTIRQLMLPGRVAAAFASPDGAGLALLRTMSAGFQDQNKISDNLTLQYGFTMDVVSFLDHLNYYSPYARLTYAVDRNDDLIVAYTSGNGRPDLSSGQTGDSGAAPVADDALRRDVNALGVFPRMSLLDGRTQIQRGVEYEAVYVHRSGSRTYRASLYRQDISNAAVTMAAPAGFFSGADVLPDLFSNSSILNAGTFQSTGVAVSATQNLGSNASATVIYGDAGALTTDKTELVSHSPDELRAMIREGRRQSLTTRISATVPHSGTHLVASYQWTGDHRALMAGNLYSTAGMQPLPGMNVCIRQPIPGFGGRIEATGDIRNILAQGYLPLTTADGQRILLVQNPRSVRGGLSFTF